MTHIYHLLSFILRPYAERRGSRSTCRLLCKGMLLPFAALLCIYSAPAGEVVL